MSHSLKLLDQQVIVVTGASGIGLATAQQAVKHGAKVVLAARSLKLQDIEAALNEAGGEAIAVTADVSSVSDVASIAEAAIDNYGRIDMWVNNAGVAIYGRLEEVSERDSRCLFDINFWGVVNGSLAALPICERQEVR
ncbi:MAG: SDR family NAD(P)-dependent oxidoreductase [Myxococcales bacterium]